MEKSTVERVGRRTGTHEDRRELVKGRSPAAPKSQKKVQANMWRSLEAEPAASSESWEGTPRTSC